jgi:hypothetical protein
LMLLEACLKKLVMKLSTIKKRLRNLKPKKDKFCSICSKLGPKCHHKLEKMLR